MRTPARPRPTSLFRFSPLAAALACALSGPAALAQVDPRIVTKAADDFTNGTLRNAIIGVNSLCSVSPQTISFVGGPFIIALGSQPLPPVTCGNVTIQGDGSTIDGTAVAPPANAAACGFSTSSTLVRIDNLTFSGFNRPNVPAALCGWLDATNLSVHDNTLGVHLKIGNGTLKSSRVFNNATRGVLVDGGSTVGGALAADRNYIYGNGDEGVYLSYGGTVQNNYIGVTPTGGASGNEIGVALNGNALITGNLVSGNITTGILINGPSDANVSNNKVGLNATGNGPMANGLGIEAVCTTAATISSNHISGNGQGLKLAGVSSSNVGSNTIGLGTDNSPVGNGGSGVVMTTSPTCGGNPTANINFNSNRVAFSGGHGVSVLGSNSVGNRLTVNNIYSNGGKNIDLDFSTGLRPNDNLDVDVGPNNGQNAPVISSVTYSGGQTIINFTLNSRPNASFTIEFYTNSAAGVAAGETVLGITAYGVNTDASGNATGTKTYTGTYSNITALAISNNDDPLFPTSPASYRAGDTSEFSLPLAAPSASVTPATVNFSDVNVGSSSGSTTINIVSNGGQDYVIQNITTAPDCYGGPICAGGDFSCSNACTNSTPYAPTFGCNITASFAPNSPGGQTTSFYICDNTSASPRTITLSGNGTIPASVMVSPTTFDFGSLALDGTSPPHVFQFSNPGTSPVNVGQVFVSGDEFQISSNNCGPSIPANGSCQAGVFFAPTFPGLRSGTLSMVYGTIVADVKGAVRAAAAGGVATAGLTGTAIANAVPITVIPGFVDFGDVLVGKASPPQLIKFANSGESDAAIGPVTTSGAFTIVTNSCGASIPPRGFCLTEVSFAPTQPGQVNGSVSVSTGNASVEEVKNAARAAAAGSAGASLTGNGTQGPALALPKSVDLGSYTLGSPNPLTKLVELTNSGNAVLTFTSITVTGPFTIDNQCPINLQPGSSCQVRVMFSVTERGEYTGGLSVVTNAQGGSGLIALTARAQPVPRPVIRLTPTFMGFGDRVVGSVATSQRLTVLNEGGAVAVLGALTTSVDFLVLGTTCGLSLDPSSSCFAEVAFRPVGFGVRSGQLLVNSNAEGSPNVLSLVGTGCRPFIASGSRLGTRSNCSP